MFPYIQWESISDGLPESPDDWTLIIIVNQGRRPSRRTVMSGCELPEPEWFIAWELNLNFNVSSSICYKPCSHSPVAVGKVAKTSSKKAHNDQDLDRIE